MKWSIYYGRWTQTGDPIPQSFPGNAHHTNLSCHFSYRNQILAGTLTKITTTRSNGGSAGRLREGTTDSSRFPGRCFLYSPFSGTIISCATVMTAVNLGNLRHQTWWHGENITTATPRPTPLHHPPAPKILFCSQDSRLREASINNYI